MSRTLRKNLRQHISDVYGRLEYWRMNRGVRTASTKRAEVNSVQDMLDAGYQPSDRARTRGNPGSRKHLPSSWDSIDVAAIHELDCGHHKAPTFPKERSMKNREVKYEIRGCPDCRWLERTASKRIWWATPGVCHHPSLECAGVIDKVRYGRFAEFCPLGEVTP